MQIHEITEGLNRSLTRLPIKTGLAQQAKQRNTTTATQPPAQPQPLAQPQPQAEPATWKDRAHQAADYFLSSNPTFRSVMTPYAKKPTTAPSVSVATPPNNVTLTPTKSTTNIGPVIATTPKGQAPVPATQYPPITLGSGPKAQVFVNKGQGYIDSKTGKPMPPAIVQAMGLK